MINYLWFFLIISGIVFAAINGKMGDVSMAIFQGVEDSVEIIIKLLGPMALWLGLMNIAKESGLTKQIGKLIKPLFHFIFPQVPEKHPASGAIILNLTANIFGLGNSATPLGIKAMQELQKLNNSPTRASLAMCTLLALNTSSITIIPATIISLRAVSGSDYPGIIIISTIFATSVSTITAIIVDRCFRVIYKN